MISPGFEIRCGEQTIRMRRIGIWRARDSYVNVFRVFTPGLDEGDDGFVDKALEDAKLETDAEEGASDEGCILLRVVLGFKG